MYLKRGNYYKLCIISIHTTVNNYTNLRDKMIVLRSIFNMPKPLLVKEVKYKSRRKRSHVSKGKGKAKPRLPDHICTSECNCQVCRDYINNLDNWRSRK